MLAFRQAAYLLVAACAAVFIACGGKDDKPAVPSEARAAQVAHAALIEPAGLSGEWALFSTDNFRNDDASLPDIEACRPTRTLALDMSKANRGRAQRALQLPIPNRAYRAQLEMHVRVFDKDATAREFLKTHRAVMTGDAYTKCLAEGFQAMFGPNASVKFANAHGRAPRDGVTAAFDQDFKSGDETLELHTDSYAWVQGNVFILLLISGPRSLDSDDFVKEALQKVQAQVELALKLPK